MGIYWKGFQKEEKQNKGTKKFLDLLILQQM